MSRLFYKFPISGVGTKKKFIFTYFGHSMWRGGPKNSKKNYWCRTSGVDINFFLQKFGDATKKKKKKKT